MGCPAEGIGKNCFYRFLTNTSYNWRSLLLGVAKQFLRIVERRGGEHGDTPDFYIVDDTTLEKTSCHFEGLSRVHDHTSGRHVLGYKMLTLSYCDGKNTIPLDSCFPHDFVLKSHPIVNKAVATPPEGSLWVTSFRLRGHFCRVLHKENPPQ